VTAASDAPAQHSRGRVVLSASSAAGPSPWLPLIGTLAMADALRAVARVPAEVAWPDAVTLQAAACGGGTAGMRRTAAAAAEGSEVRVTLALTTSMLDAEPGWTSVLAEGGDTDAEAVAAAFASAFDRRSAQLVEDPASLRADYRSACVTVGRRVEVDGAHGVITGVDADARLLVSADGVERVWDGPPPV
jgi:BirA family biotin operon repressor/biotin-[acetyl-CoA-carboxylase] ligase